MILSFQFTNEETLRGNGNWSDVTQGREAENGPHLPCGHASTRPPDSTDSALSLQELSPHWGSQRPCVLLPGAPVAVSKGMATAALQTLSAMGASFCPSKFFCGSSTLSVDGVWRWDLGEVITARRGHEGGIPWWE